MQKNMLVIGTGAWGTALAITAHRSGNKVTMWSKEPELKVEIEKTRINRFLPGVNLPEGIKIVNEIDRSASVDCIMIAVPAQFIKDVLADLDLESFISLDIPIVICSKGIDIESLSLMSEVVQKFLPHHTMAILSGPSFAHEVAQNLPTAVTIACEEEDTGSQIMSHAVQ